MLLKFHACFIFLFIAVCSNAQLIEEWSQFSPVDLAFDEYSYFEMPELFVEENGTVGVLGLNKMIKYDSLGNEQWRNDYSRNWPSSYGIGRYNYCIDEEGNIYTITNDRIYSNYFDTVETEVFLVKYSSGGEEIWRTQLTYFNSLLTFQGTSLAIKEDRIFITGLGEEELYADLKIFIVGFDINTGNELWYTTWGESQDGNDWPNRLFIDSDGDILISGRSNSSVGSNYLLLKYDTEGNLLLHQTDSGQDEEHNVVNYSAMTSLDQVAISTPEMETVAFANDGTVAWTYKPESFLPSNVTGDWVKAMYAVENGDLILSGRHRAESGENTILTYRLDKHGEVVWSNRYTITDNDSYASTFAIEMDKYGDIFLAGNCSYSNQNGDGILAALITKLDGTNGNVLWHWLDDNGDKLELFTALHLTEDKEVYATGTYVVGEASFYITKKFKDLTTGINPINNLEQYFSIYPNPTHLGKINIELKGEWPNSSHLTIFDSSGRLMKTVMDLAKNQSVTFDESGLYLLQIKSQDFVETRRVLVID